MDKTLFETLIKCIDDIRITISTSASGMMIYFYLPASYKGVFKDFEISNASVWDCFKKLTALPTSSK